MRKMTIPQPKASRKPREIERQAPGKNLPPKNRNGRQPSGGRFDRRKRLCHTAHGFFMTRRVAIRQSFPTRLFHFFLACLFTATAIAQRADLNDPQYVSEVTRE